MWHLCNPLSQFLLWICLLVILSSFFLVKSGKTFKDKCYLNYTDINTFPNQNTMLFPQISRIIYSKCEYFNEIFNSKVFATISTYMSWIFSSRKFIANMAFSNVLYNPLSCEILILMHMHTCIFHIHVL